ncbi:MAG: DUF6754 domain-containing protein, partial [Candidatus Zixiibacteriota bacterium]
MRRFLVFTLGLALPVVSALAQNEGSATQVYSDSLSGEHSAVLPPVEVEARDHEYDNGAGVDVFWAASAEDTLGATEFKGYIVFRRGSDGSYDSLDFVVSTIDSSYDFIDRTVTKDSTYSYAVTSVHAGGRSPMAESADSVTPDAEWFNLGRIWVLSFMIFLSASVMYFIYSAKKGKSLFLRKLAGLEAVEEAIGRATEMGRPILFIPGILDMDDVQTIAGMTILSKVARQAADYESRILVPTRASLAMTAARETVKEAYMTAGRADVYRQDDIYYVSDEQFGYVAAVNGIMVRDKPATCFYLGAFFAESLILAETGNSIGAIQIGGTAMPAQLPFFVAACDYTLIGEELFAASAYLSHEPKQLGSLKGQDVGKALAMIVIVI